MAAHLSRVFGLARHFLVRPRGDGADDRVGRWEEISQERLCIARGPDDGGKAWVLQGKGGRL